MGEQSSLFESKQMFHHSIKHLSIFQNVQDIELFLYLFHAFHLCLPESCSAAESKMLEMGLNRYCKTLPRTERKACSVIHRMQGFVFEFFC